MPEDQSPDRPAKKKSEMAQAMRNTKSLESQVFDLGQIIAGQKSKMKARIKTMQENVGLVERYVHMQEALKAKSQVDPFVNRDVNSIEQSICLT